ncbi:MAG: hypothetical protein GX389_03305 [Clostridiaceae bacterium]|nr:hypothetical protein [Clostridiaceae bacterium]
MPANENIRHIFRNSMGVTTCIWYKNGLFMSMLDSDNKWGPPFLLSDNTTPDFSALLKSDDDICTCFVDYGGRLLYMNACEEKKEPIVLLESLICGTYPYNVRLVEADSFIHAFYVVSHNRKQLLTYQKIGGVRNEMPEVEGVIIREGKNFAVCADETDIHLFFVTDVQGISLLVHRKISDGRASKPVTTPFPYSPSLRLQAVMAKDGPIYILASSDEGNDNSVIYKFDPILNKFSKSLEVYNASSGHGSDSLILVRNTPYVVRSLKSSFLFARISRDLKTVADESKIDLSGREIPLKCKYQSNFKKDKDFRCDFTPMLFGSGLKFPFDLKTLAMQKNNNEDEDRDQLHEHIRALEDRIGFLENTIREILRP